MNIDFTKLGKGNPADDVLPPRDIFSVLPEKDKRYQYLRDVQGEVLNEWFENKDNVDTVIKMNTGSGKTVVGLLIAKSCLNQRYGPAVYVSPDPYLVKQVLAEAEALGIEVTEDPESLRFVRGQSILVINIYKLINGKSVFGVADEGTKIAIGTVIIDDVHACLATTEEQFTLELEAPDETYYELFELFKEDLKQQSAATLLDIQALEPNINMLVPYWAWHNKIDNVRGILHEKRDADKIKFNWPLIRSKLHLCRCVFGGGIVEISPRCMPIEVIPSFTTAKRRVFMSATLTDDSVLISHYDVDLSSVSRLVTPSSANDIGDRMILVPQEFNPNIQDADLKKFFKELSVSYNTVIIVPSYKRAKYWEEEADLTLSAHNLYEGIQRLKDEHIGLVVLVNKYDGIDLPDDACRILVIDGLPDVRRKIDRIEQSILPESAQPSAHLIQRIEQGMGRGIRSNEDQCVVFLMGRSLTSHLYAQGAIQQFTPTTRAQVNLSDMLAEQLRGKDLSEIRQTIDLSLQRDSDWLKASKGALVHLKYEKEGSVNPIILHHRRAFNAASRGDYPTAIQEIRDSVNEVQNPRIKGWLEHQLAEYVNYTNPVDSQIILKSAVFHNPLVTHPLEGITYSRVSKTIQNQAKQCAQHMTGVVKNANEYIILINGLLDNLLFQPDTAAIFEETMKQLAIHIGFFGQRPEAEFGKGPDVLWGVGDLQYLVIECKNGAIAESISKSYCDQLAGSMNWFNNAYENDCHATPIIIHRVNLFNRSCSPPEHTRVITYKKLVELCNAVREFTAMVATPAVFGNEIEVAKALRHFHFTSREFINQFTSIYRVED